MIIAESRFGLPVGVLDDGTPFYAPIGEVIVDSSLVTCHLCGRLLRSVTAHLRAHGWTKEQYCAAFGLERGQSLEGPQTRKLRSAAFTARLVFEPAVRRGSAAGRARAKSGELARQAAEATLAAWTRHRASDVVLVKCQGVTDVPCAELGIPARRHAE